MEVVKLGGREFQVIANGPVKFDLYMLALVKKAGIDSINISAGQTTEEFVDALLDQLMRSGMSMEILGAMMAPADLDLRKWTPAVAAESTAFIEELMEPSDKAIVKGMVAQVLIGFFQSGLASLTTSPTVSPKKARASVKIEPETSAGGV